MQDVSLLQSKNLKKTTRKLNLIQLRIMTKEEKIKEAYFKLFNEESLSEKEERFDALKSFIDSHGWLSGSLVGVDKNLLDFSGHEERPKSLQGIENNNGWIKIESGLPKSFSGNYFVYDGINIFIASMSGLQFRCARTHRVCPEITHYQPIQKPKPPIY